MAYFVFLISDVFNICLYLFALSVVWWSEFLATDPEVRVPFPALPDFLRSSGSGTGSYLKEKVAALV
jgi:hypothetical protein